MIVGPPRANMRNAIGQSRRSPSLSKTKRFLLISFVSSLSGPALAQVEAAAANDTETAQPDDAAESAPSGPSQQECLDAHGKAQALKHEKKFIEASEQLLICSSATCPGMVIADCGEWIGDLDRRTPSLAFSVKLDGSEVGDAQVSLDGTVVTDRTQVLKVNPGRHLAAVELAPFPRKEEVVFARDGAGTQVVRFEFSTPTEPAADVPPPSALEPSAQVERPVPTLFYPLMGLSVAGFASFGVFSLIGSNRQSELEDNCEPDCSTSELQPMKNAYLIGDISLAVGAASLIGAAITYWTRPTPVTPAETSLSFEVEPTLNAQSIGLGVSAVQTW